MVTIMTDEELLARSSDEKLDRNLILLRDNFKEISNINEKVNNHVSSATIRFDATDKEILSLKNANGMLKNELYLLKNKQIIEQVINEYESKKYNLIINNLPEKSDHWETNIESIEIIHAFLKKCVKCGRW